MDLSEQINEIIESTKDISLNLEQENRTKVLKNDFSNAVEKAVDNAAKYVIKAMPVPDAVKDILMDVKDSIKTKDIRQIIGTVVKSTVREGMELIGISEVNISSLTDFKNIASKGGLIPSLKNGIEIVAKNYLKGNIVGEYVYDFFDKLKSYIMNKEFTKKLTSIIDKLEKKKDKFLQRCEDWYSEYKSMNLDKLNSIASELDTNKYILTRYSDCAKENSVIQNMTAMVNSKKSFLTQNQQRLCQVI